MKCQCSIGTKIANLLSFDLLYSITKNQKLDKLRFERFESIKLKHSISELELDCFFFEFKKFYFSSSSSTKTIEFNRVRVRSPGLQYQVKAE